MSTIRPLATIAVLAVVGAFLAWKINEGPSVALDDSWSTESPIADTPNWPEQEPAGEASSATARSAPSWDAPPSAVAPPAGTPSLSLPPIREPSAPPAISGRVPSLGSSTPDLTQQAQQTPPAAPPAPTLPEAPPAAPAIDNQVTQATAMATPTIDALPPAPTGFEAAWPAIQTALQNDELTRAHRMLSQWAIDPTLPESRRAEVEQLLGQLAGTIVYSMEHRLEPPHVVAPGETLATIAQQYDVPWQLLAKINGVPAAEAVQEGQKLKVLRGPFDAVVNLSRGEMTLLLDDRYAGKFPVRVAGATPEDGLWQVDQKQQQPGPEPQRKIVLSGAAGETVEMSADPAPTQRTQLAIASHDLEDLFDILSVGSSVTILR